MRTALTIAGSDSCGGAGIQVDLKTFTVLGVYGMSVLTAITAQNTRGVTAAVELDSQIIRQQIDAVATDLPVHACKTGMLGSVPIIEAVESALREHRLTPYVCDPVMVAKSGDPLLKSDAVEAMRKRLFPLAAILTPNLRETAALLGMRQIEPTIQAARDAARRLTDLGAAAVVVKAIAIGDRMVDVFYDGSDFAEFAGALLPKEQTHGSGCCFSAALAAGLAMQLGLPAALDQAKRLVTAAIASALPYGAGTKAVNVVRANGQRKG